MTWKNGKTPKLKNTLERPNKCELRSPNIQYLALINYINKTTRTCFINDEVSSSTLVEELTSHG